MYHYFRSLLVYSSIQLCSTYKKADRGDVQMDFRLDWSFNGDKQISNAETLQYRLLACPDPFQILAIINMLDTPNYKYVRYSKLYKFGNYLSLFFILYRKLFASQSMEKVKWNRLFEKTWYGFKRIDKLNKSKYNNQTLLSMLARVLDRWKEKSPTDWNCCGIGVGE